MVPSEYCDVTRIICDSYADIVYTRDIIPRTVAILNSRNFLCGRLDSVMTYVCMINYSIALCFAVDRQMMCTRLRELGIPAMYYNLSTHGIKITFVDRESYEGDEMIRRKSRKLYETTVKITMNGKITLSGGGGKRMENAYLEIMTHIVRICTDSPEIMVG